MASSSEPTKFKMVVVGGDHLFHSSVNQQLIFFCIYKRDDKTDQIKLVTKLNHVNKLLKRNRLNNFLLESWFCLLDSRLFCINNDRIFKLN